ncbi:HutD family protein [Peptoniphilus sp. MSJ-1]|uniref:HutD family protein n=1 Tax=Peptoniphilus ovalis TaxID=2841503 RepID=A0ABS6FK43_9FIRM|nr:HutD family protein [Peptoniphilus ovalis]MBU5669838.1 HutD family protein [Peptoniphilus ovalis]
MKFIKRDEFKDSKWSGGVTTEVFIYPEEASVSEKNFDLRISTATCELEESTYTPYNGFYRYITPIDNVMNIKTRGEEYELNPYEVLFFDGDAQTKSSGDVRDFNLIIKKGVHAKMYSLNINDFKYKVHDKAIIFNYDNRLKANGEKFEEFSAVYLENEEVEIIGNGKIIIAEF